MVSDNGDLYRFNLSFRGTSDEAIRAGTLLSALGHKKSIVVVAALCEYMDRHPEIITDHKIDVSVTPSFDREEIEQLITYIVAQKLKNASFVQSVPDSDNDDDSSDVAGSVSEDVTAMLDNLGVFGL